MATLPSASYYLEWQLGASWERPRCEEEDGDWRTTRVFTSESLLIACLITCYSRVPGPILFFREMMPAKASLKDQQSSLEDEASAR